MHNPNRLSTARKQKGFGLIELAIAIAIGAAIIFGVFVMVKRAQSGRAASNEAKNLMLMSADLRTKFSGQGSFAGLSADNLIKMGIVPSNMISGTSIRSGFSTDVTVAPINLNGAANDGFEFTYTVPSDDCGTFVQSVEGAFARVSIAGTQIKNVPAGDSEVNVGDLANCNATGTSNAPVTLTFAQGR